MMDGYDKNDRDEIFSKAVRAGKRTYFFDVKATRKNDYYLTITESKKRFTEDGQFHFEKHKIFLYKEDFDKFAEGMSFILDFVKDCIENGLPEDLEERKKAMREQDFSRTDDDF